MGDVPQSGGDGTADPDPIASLGADTGGGGGCSDPVSVELSMGGDYYHACCGDANLDIPEGPKLPFVGDKVRGPPARRSSSLAPRSVIIDYCPCGEMGLRHPYMWCERRIAILGNGNCAHLCQMVCNRSDFSRDRNFVKYGMNCSLFSMLSL
jgi:hypothetical protein